MKYGKTFKECYRQTRTYENICFRGGVWGEAQISSASSKRLEPNQQDFFKDSFRVVRVEIQRKTPARGQSRVSIWSHWGHNKRTKPLYYLFFFKLVRTVGRGRDNTFAPWRKGITRTSLLFYCKKNRGSPKSCFRSPKKCDSRFLF